jgi:nitroreductase
MDAVEALITRVSPAELVEPGPTAQQLDRILAAAVAAPDHGRIRPWRFVVVEGEGRSRLGEIMARSLQRREPETPAARLEYERKKALRAPLIIVVAAAVQENAKVPDIEQIVATGAAAQNLLLAAHASGLGAFWRTGALAYDPEVKAALGFAATDAIVGFIYIGSVGRPGQPRQSPVEPVVRRL